MARWSPMTFRHSSDHHGLYTHYIPIVSPILHGQIMLNYLKSTFFLDPQLKNPIHGWCSHLTSPGRTALSWARSICMSGFGSEGCRFFLNKAERIWDGGHGQEERHPWLRCVKKQVGQPNILVENSWPMAIHGLRGNFVFEWFRWTGTPWNLRL